MQAIETYGKIDNKGYLTINNPLLFKNMDVKVIVLFPEDQIPNDQVWLNELMQNPAFDFLKDDKEDIYTLNDGKPVDINEI